MKKKASAQGRDGTAWEKVQEALAVNTSNLYGLLMRSVDDVEEVRFKHRGGGDWMVIMKKVDDDGTPVVAFGVAYDFVSALLAANGAIAANKWRVDKPWKPE